MLGTEDGGDRMLGTEDGVGGFGTEDGWLETKDGGGRLNVEDDGELDIGGMIVCIGGGRGGTSSSSVLSSLKVASNISLSKCRFTAACLLFFCCLGVFLLAAGFRRLTKTALSLPNNCKYLITT